MNGWNSGPNWMRTYKSIFPNDAQNMANILQGLDPASIMRDASITASMNAHNSENPTDQLCWGQVANRFDIAMALQSVGSAVGGLIGIGGVGRELINPKSITNIQAISASEANAPFVAKGWGAPYDRSTQVRTFTLATDLTFMGV